MSPTRRSAPPEAARGFRMTRTLALAAGIGRTKLPRGASETLVLRHAPLVEKRRPMVLELTLAQAVEEAAKCDPTRGFRFISEEGVPGATPQTAIDPTPRSEA